MACHLHLILCTWDGVTTCTPVTVFFPLGVLLCCIFGLSKQLAKSTLLKLSQIPIACSYLASFPGAEEGEERAPGTHLFAHARNYSKGHVVELGACTNMTINGSRE